MTKEQILSKFNHPSVKLWDCNDSDLLTCDDPIEAIIDLVDSQVSSVGEDIPALIAEIGDVTVTGYRPDVVTEQFRYTLATQLYDLASEVFFDTYGNPEGRDSNPFDEDKHMPLIETLVAQMCSDAKAWRCKRVVEVVLSPEEVLATMQLWVPEYFETT